jgi:hypothetical protein
LCAHDDVDFINAPDLSVRDLSHSRSRARQLVDLTKDHSSTLGSARATMTTNLLPSTMTMAQRPA